MNTISAALAVEESTNDENPEQWDDIEEALKHCDKVADRHGDTWHYANRVLYLTMFGVTKTWPILAHHANAYGPFRRA